MNAGITETLVDNVHRWPANDPDLRQRCRQLLVDGLACAVAGSGYEGPSIAADMEREQQAVRTASAIGHNFATSQIGAARVNGMSMHVLDFEPMWRPANHAVSPVVPAALAVAERLEVAGAAPMGAILLSAIAKGIEIAGRLRLSSGQYDIDALRFHPPGVVGPLGAAMAAATVLGLEPDKVCAALGIATSRACGLLVNVGSMTKALHCGDAAAHGLEAALLAQRGFTASADPFSGTQGYAAAYFGETFDPSPLLTPMAAAYALDPGPAWKLFPAQYGTHYAITAALDCRKAVVDPVNIAAVSATVPVMPYVDRPKPRTGLEGKFSFQYGIAAALLDGKVDVGTYSDARRFARDMDEMLDKISLHYDEGRSRQIDTLQVDVEVQLKDGSSVRRCCDAPAGSWRRPASQSDLDSKARQLLEPSIGAARTERLFELVYGGRGDFAVRDLMALVALRTVPEGEANVSAAAGPVQSSGRR